MESGNFFNAGVKPCHNAVVVISSDLKKGKEKKKKKQAWKNEVFA